jgi:HD-GYP domain-containing protein (c-di-GMP phosphodiesterase class II)
MSNSVMHGNTNSAIREQANGICKALLIGGHPWVDLLRPMRLSSAELDGFEEATNPVPDTERILFALAQAVEQRDRHTAGHCERLAFISVAMGIFMGLDHASLLALYRGGYLHDVGKVGIPDSILFKPGKLSEQEWVVMRTHPIRGVDICRHLKSLAPVVPIIRHHHERWDGSGYPDGLRGEEIPLVARVLQIADIYDALTSPRPYKDAFSPAQALHLIREETDRGWRDPELVNVFFVLHKDVISKAAEFTAGSDSNLEAMRTALMGLQLESSTGAS